MHQIAIKLLTEPCQPRLMAYCPTMDLVATVTQSQNVDVYRLNGQRVFGAIFRDEDEYDTNEQGDISGHRLTVQALAWRRDGVMLAVACSNGIISLMDSFSGKIVHRLESFQAQSVESPTSSFRESQRSFSSSHSVDKSSPPAPRNVSCLSWSTHFSQASTMKHNLDQVTPKVSLDDLLVFHADIEQLLNVGRSLPRALAALDVEVSLPKLATLPPTGTEDDVFGTRNSIDNIFHASRQSTSARSVSDDMVDTLIVGFNDASLHLRIFDSFEIGNIDLRKSLPSSTGAVVAKKYSTHPLLPIQTCVVETETNKQTSKAPQKELHLLAIDLRFIPQTSHNLPLLASKSTQLQNLLRYLDQIQKHLSQEVKAAFDLPARFLRNVNESLAEQDSAASFVTAAYHLILTGECPSRMKEWLVDEVGERGLKRWEKAVGDCLDTVRRMVEQCLLPAIERCQLIISRLDGLSKFTSTAVKLGLESRDIRAARETLEVLGIVGEDLLRDVCTESKEFAAFMKWLKWEAEVQALEDTSERAEELRENWTGEPEIGVVLAYIRGAMQQTRLRKYVSDPVTNTSQAAPSAASIGDAEVQFYAEFKKTRDSGKDSEMPKLGQLLARLKAQCQKAFATIAETLKKNILIGHILELSSSSDVNTMDMRILPSSDDDTAFEVYIIAKHLELEHAIAFVRLDIHHEGGRPLAIKSRKPSTLELPNDAGHVTDVKFVDDEGFFVLATQDGTASILWHGTASGTNGELTKSWETRHDFEEGMLAGKSGPVVMDVNGHKGRRVVTVMDRTGTAFAVLDIDSTVDESHMDENGGIRDDTGDEIMTG